MGALIIVVFEAVVQILRQLLEASINLVAERHLIELLQ